MDSPAHDPRFQDIVSSLEHFEAIIGQPSPRIVAKVTDTIDDLSQVFIHCTKCIVRSHLWEPASWPSVDGLASLAEFMVAHGKLDITVADMASRIDDDARNRLY